MVVVVRCSLTEMVDAPEPRGGIAEKWIEWMQTD